MILNMSKRRMLRLPCTVNVINDEDTNKKNGVLHRIIEISRTQMTGFENLIRTGHIEGKRNREISEKTT